MVDFSSALSAYKAAANRVVEKSTDTDMNASAGSGFGNVLKSTLDQSIEAARQSEAVSLKAIAGQADMQDVVLAISNAETALGTMVAVRDKVISAYQEIMRMQI